MKRLLGVALSVLCFSAPAFAVVYSVPTEREALTPYARFEVQDFKMIKVGERSEVSYTLPTELTGDPVQIVLSGRQRDDGSLRLSGERGRARCENDVCEVDYRNLAINTAAVVERLRAISSSEEEFQARLQVAMDFGGNPIGFLHLK